MELRRKLNKEQVKFDAKKPHLKKLHDLNQTQQQKFDALRQKKEREEQQKE